jgi:hypothetical protein
MRRGRIIKVLGLIALIFGAVTGISTLVVRDQITRHRRDLFSVRDYVAWEPRRLLRRRAHQIIERMERHLDQTAGPRAGIAG